MKVVTGLILISVMVLMVLAAMVTQKLISQVILPSMVAESTGVHGHVSIMAEKHESYLNAQSSQGNSIQVGRVVINDRFIK